MFLAPTVIALWELIMRQTLKCHFTGFHSLRLIDSMNVLKHDLCKVSIYTYTQHTGYFVAL